MAFRLDHVVIAVDDLSQAVADYRQLGFTVYPGGAHHGGVSHNALVIFADGSYFELIAYRAPADQVRWWQVLSRAGEGLVDFALLPDDMMACLTAARARGLDLIGPVDGGRMRPDGTRIDWQIVRPTTTDLPFWCGDLTPRTLRVPEGEMRQHPNTVTGISAVQIAVLDVGVSAPRYAALLGEDTLTRVGDRAQLRIGEAVLDLSADAAAQAHIARRGEGPMALTLRGAAPAVLDLILSHGAPMRIAP